MKYALLVGDGMAGYPLEELGNRTTLQAANTPNMDLIASGKTGLFRSIPPGMEAGSDIANLSILGYPPEKYYTGRGPLEAIGMGISLEPGETAFRCNLITEKDGILFDYSAGHISGEESRELMKALNKKLGNPFLRFYPGVSYRNIMKIKGNFESVKCIPPHDIVGKRIEGNLPSDETLKKLILDSKYILESHEINKKRERKANMIWLWGGGKAPEMPPFEKVYRVKGSVIAGVHLIKGIGRCIGFDVVEVPGATGYLDTDYASKAEYALKSLEKRDFVFVHVEAPDEAGHMGNIEEKIRAIEKFDDLVVGRILEGLKRFEEYRILVLPDHPTPISERIHKKDPVPFAIFSSEEEKRFASFDESSVERVVLEGRELMEIFLV
ncbi:MAG: cofactor-independent phosphoglycerate mutase [Candidatus Syntropharchaeia archaeon]